MLGEVPVFHLNYYNRWTPTFLNLATMEPAAAMNIPSPASPSAAHLICSRPSTSAAFGTHRLVRLPRVCHLGWGWRRQDPHHRPMPGGTQYGSTTASSPAYAWSIRRRTRHGCSGGVSDQDHRVGAGPCSGKTTMPWSLSWRTECKLKQSIFSKKNGARGNFVPFPWLADV
jgi:hypothetical protein